ncbi:Programmed cell death protein 2-like [Nymphaea thermarum]|nr:Programmed cell death protein 2-like [Nymphaea thermarum]
MEGVILGMPGPWADDNHESSGHYTTKIGGLPDWPLPRQSIRDELLKCSVCSGHLSLVAQVYAPIGSSDLNFDERVLFVLACSSPNCGSNPLSWRTLRVQKTNSEAGTTKTVSNSRASASTNSDQLGEDTWSFGGDDDDGCDGLNLSMAELGKALAEAAAAASHGQRRRDAKDRDELHEKPGKRVIDPCLPVMPCFYIYIGKESTLQNVSCLSAACSVSTKGSGHFDSAEDKDSWEAEDYEYDRALDVDRTYMKFKKRLDLYPEQCLRYSYGGKPLLASDQLQEPGCCSLCGGPRHYEMQLMPPLLYFLKEGSEASGAVCPTEYWNWMTVIVYTCSKSCFLHADLVDHEDEQWIVVEEATLIQYEGSLQGSARLVGLT